MRTLIPNLKYSRFFLFPYGIFLLCAGIVLSVYSKDEIHIYINHHYSHLGDVLMPWITLGADGLVIAVLVLLMFAWNRRFALFTGVSCILASAITQLLKHTIFAGELRPKLFFESPSPLRFVPGVENHLYDSFPSGHSTIAFAFFFCLVFAVKNNFLKTLFFLLALLIGYSRIYLSQHFLSDVFFGSLIGTLTTLFVMSIAMNKGWLKIQNLSAQDEA